MDKLRAVLLRVSRLKTNDTKNHTYQRLRHPKRISREKHITRALVDVSPASTRYNSV